jgi:uncharacterized membrane protein (UPF0127 family)
LCIDADEPSVRLVHRRGPPDDRTERLLASDVDVAQSRLAQARGLMFRRSIPEEYALVFPFDGVEARTLHMLFVPFAIDAVWLVDDEVTATARLSPFVGLARGDADTVVELPAGAADAVAVGDEVVVSGGEA